MAVKDVLDLVKKNKVEIVDFKFIDVPGLWQHFSIPAAELTADLFEDGIGFDGSSIRGFQSINESDMLLIPDPDSAMMDPFTEHLTLSLICNVIDAVTRESYSRDPAVCGPEGREVFKVQRHSGYQLLGSRDRVFHLRQHTVQSNHQRRVLLYRFRRGVLERG